MILTVCVPDGYRNYFEQSWLRELFGTFWPEVCVRWSDFVLLEITGGVVLVSNGSDLLNQKVQYLIDREIRFIVVLLSDEMLKENCEFIDSPFCLFVFRNYVHPGLIGNPKVKIFGLGYKSGFASGGASKVYWDRGLDWNFVGSIHHADRQSAVDCFGSALPGLVYKTSGFNARDYLDVKEYARILGNSVYTICPFGHVNMDTFRLYEALEAGSIPVTLRHAPSLRADPHYWYYVFRGDDVPFIVADNWLEAAERAKTLIGSIQGQIMMEVCRAFWSKWKATWKLDFQSAVARLLETR
jgi:hypothetical protein